MQNIFAAKHIHICTGLQSKMHLKKISITLTSLFHIFSKTNERFYFPFICILHFHSPPSPPQATIITCLMYYLFYYMYVLTKSTLLWVLVFYNLYKIKQIKKTLSILWFIPFNCYRIICGGIYYIYSMSFSGYKSKTFESHWSSVYIQDSLENS